MFVSDFQVKNNHRMWLGAFRCSAIRLKIMAWNTAEARKHVRHAELLTKAIRDQQVDA
jgi:hypothetical protein